jgi:glycosyltransferase involved in cell wall biosynthesis
MRGNNHCTVIIPALNEEATIAEVIAQIPDWVDRIIVADNGSTDATADRAREAEADVVAAPQRGYGSACLAGIAAAGETDILVFVDGDLSDYPDRMATLVDPIVGGGVEMVIGSRVLGGAEPGSLTMVQRFGNWLACRLIRLFWGVRYTDLGPFRAITRMVLERIDMRDTDFGWTVEMQVKAAQHGLRVTEVPVPYRKRIGVSKISGTIRGTVAAGTKILWVIFRSAIRRNKIDPDDYR